VFVNDITQTEICTAQPLALEHTFVAFKIATERLGRMSQQGLNKFQQGWFHFMHFMGQM
jgi:hypothetical protein